MTFTNARSSAPLYWLALGSFAVGTESFMIAAILPDIAADLSVSEQPPSIISASRWGRRWGRWC